MDKGTSKFISKGDIFLIAVVLFLAASALLLKHFTTNAGARAVVTVDGRVKEELSLKKDTEITILSPEGYNTIVVKAGKVSVSASDCRDHICVRHHAIDKQGETIICLPHKLIVEVKE